MRLTYAVELASEDFQDNEREAELTERGADVGSFEGALSRADLHELRGREDHGAGAVEA